MEILRETIEIFGQIIGFFFVYYLLRLAYKLYGKNQFSGAVLVVLASVFVLLCSLQWFQVWAKSFIATNITARLNTFGQQLDAVQKTTTEMHSQLANLQIQMDQEKKALDEAQSKIEDAGTNVNAVQATTTEIHQQLTSHKSELSEHQKELDDVEGKIRDAATSAASQQSIATSQFQRIFAVQSELASVETNLAAQQKELAEITGGVRSLYGKATNDVFTGHP